ncbi:MAG: recombination regulator RecX [Spirochaetaceae bacterium]|jgi:regulatory protein|nr:recombination regulator RecX [Spirochaetaceae bacterium]
MKGICTDGQAATPPALRDALRLVARAEQFTSGLSLKLQKKGYSRVEIRFAVDTLVNAGMLDDTRYARLWISSRVKRGADSPRRLLATLCGKGIDRRTVATALKEVVNADVEIALLRRFAEKKRARAQANDGFAREALYFEGFSAEVLDCFFDE